MSVEIEARIYEFMKSGYDLLWDHKKDLEKKSLSILTVTGTIATLIFGIGSFNFVNHKGLLSFETELPYLIFGALVTSITAMVISIDSLRK